MRTKMKALALGLCAVLLVASTVFTTMAFLTDRDSVQNTFTFGRVGISLDEAKVKPNGVVESGSDRTSSEGRVRTNEYHLIPGHEYTKDPTIHVDSNSEDCWLFVKLKNDLKPIIAGVQTYSTEDAAGTVYTVEAQMIKNGWTCLDIDNNIWSYKKIVSANENIYVFEKNGIKVAILNYTYVLNGNRMPSDMPYLVNLRTREPFWLKR
jgi:hypothetical protein